MTNNINPLFTNEELKALFLVVCNAKYCTKNEAQNTAFYKLYKFVHEKVEDVSNED